MSDEVKASAIWNGLKVDTYTNVRTGEMKLYQPKRLIPVLLARSTPANGKTEWTYDGNGANFRNIYNDQQRAIGGKELSQKEFNQRFFTQGTNSFNNIRGTILRTEKNYIDAGIPITERETVKIGHFDNRVPGSVDPASDVMVNSDGSIPSRKTSGEQLIELDPRLPTNQVPKSKDGSLSGGESQNDDDISVFSDLNKKIGVKPVGGKSELLRYPLESPPPGLNYDYIKIRAYEYKPTGVGLGKENKSDETGKGYETIILPMQPNIEDTNSVNWSTDTLSPIQAIFGNLAGNLIDSGSIQKALGAFGSTFNEIGDIVGGNENLRKFVTSYFAGQAVGANLLGRTTGMVVNPNLELLFNGPTLRTFNFSFPMSPRNKEEAEQIRKIIRAFKRNSAVQRDPQGLFLKSPRVFKIEYIYNGGVTENENGEEVATGGQHPYLNKIRLCALTSFKVNYTPDNTYMTFHENGSLTSYNISMSFNELNPIYADQYPDNEENMGF